MALKSLMVAASGGSASDGAIELACRLAHHFDAHLEGFHVRNDVNKILVADGSGMSVGVGLPQKFFDQFIEEVAATAAKTKAAFETALARSQLPPTTSDITNNQSSVWREETGQASELVTQRSRFFDLVVLGRSDRVVDESHTDTIEETLRHCGRAVLLAPANAPSSFGKRIVVGWNDSVESVRALTAALPLLGEAETVNLVTIGEEHQQSAESIIGYLAYHKINATRRIVTAISGTTSGAQLLSFAHDENADLLVLGGYGHAPWREALFGGATSDVVKVSILPVLLAH